MDKLCLTMCEFCEGKLYHGREGLSIGLRIPSVLPFSPSYLGTLSGVCLWGWFCVGFLFCFCVLALKVSGSFANSCKYSLILSVLLTNNTWS